jgi:hypothetical protein
MEQQKIRAMAMQAAAQIVAPMVGNADPDNHNSVNDNEQ